MPRGNEGDLGVAEGTGTVFTVVTSGIFCFFGKGEAEVFIFWWQIMSVSFVYSSSSSPPPPPPYSFHVGRANEPGNSEF